MALHTVIIDARTHKTKYLLGLITEMAKSEKNITVNPPFKPNRKTIEAIKAAEAGKVSKAKDIKDLFLHLEK